MEKRIDKLERVKPMALMGMMGEVAPQWVAKELNKIIDHLNSQDQEEEKYKILKEARLYPERTLGKLIKETLEDTPEEWEKEFELPDEIEHEDCIEVLADKHKLWEICSWEEPELDPDKVVAFIKQLLEERECRAREEVIKNLIKKIEEANCDSISLELLREIDLSKLTTK